MPHVHVLIQGRDALITSDDQVIELFAILTAHEVRLRQCSVVHTPSMVPSLVSVLMTLTALIGIIMAAIVTIAALIR